MRKPSPGMNMSVPKKFQVTAVQLANGPKSHISSAQYPLF